MSLAVLHLMCGKIGAGKSTLAARLVHETGGVLIAEDTWLAGLYPEELKTGQDFVRCSGRLRAVVGPHVTALLGAGVSVVLDFQGNTVDSRRWMRELVEVSGTPHQMHVLMPPDAVCLARLKARNASGTHPFEVSEAQFHAFSRHFVPPGPEEGFALVHHG